MSLGTIKFLYVMANFVHLKDDRVRFMKRNLNEARKRVAEVYVDYEC